MPARWVGVGEEGPSGGELLSGLVLGAEGTESQKLEYNLPVTH